MLKDRAEKTKNIFEGIGANGDNHNDADVSVSVNNDINVGKDTSDNNTQGKSDFGKLLAGKSSEEMVMKGLYLRKDQVKSLERYSKIANKSYSEFVRDALDMVFAEIEKAKQ